jgi:hypothetical protein
VGFRRCSVIELALKYLTGRGLSEDTIAALKIHWVSRDDAITERYVYGRQATSPDGLIVFPIEFGGDRVISVARNFYSRPEAETQHLAEINQYRQSKGLEPVKRVPKYLLPTGDRTFETWAKLQGDDGRVAHWKLCQLQVMP